jgi:hypothetical protein
MVGNKNVDNELTLKRGGGGGGGGANVRMEN